MGAKDRTVLLEHDGPTAWVRLNRPERMNALTDAMLDELDGVVAAVNNDAAISVVVLTGNGRAFCAGRDTAEIGEVRAAAHDVPPLEGHATNRIAEIEVPVIAAVNGAAVGGGMGMALMADLIYASSEALFLDGHLAAGMCPSSSAWWLPRQVPYHRAMEIFLTGRKVSASEALEFGMVTEVVASGDLESRVADVADKVGRQCTRATLARTKRAVRGAIESGWQESLREIGYLRALRNPEDL